MAATPTRVLRIATAEDEMHALGEAATILRHGGLVAFPTETVYGLGADATCDEAVRKIFQVKGRPATNPVIVHADSIAMARLCVREWTDTAQLLAERYWPGPLTLVLPRSECLSELVSAGQPTVGVRVPAKRFACQLIKAVGRPIAAPSANRSSRLSPTTAEHVLKDFEGALELVIDAGPTEVGIESTVLDLTMRQPHILRPGHITAGDIEHSTGLRVHLSSTFEPSHGARSPGQLALHYAPRTPTRRVTVENLPTLKRCARAGFLVLGHPRVELPWEPALRTDLVSPRGAEVALYAALHRMDEAGLKRIIIVDPPEGADWTAVRDRITRAAQR